MTDLNESCGQQVPDRGLNWYLSQYGISHQNPTNKKIHYICVPVILFTIAGLLFEIKLPFAAMDMSLIAMILSSLYYLRLSFILAFSMMLIFALVYLGLMNLGQHLPIAAWQFHIILFVLAWIGQFIGHKIEGQKPSFFEDLQFLLIGPAWLLSFIYKKIGIRY